jgi:hypothetical protein
MIYIYIILLINNKYMVLYSENSLIQSENITNFKKLIDIIQTEDKMEIDKIVKQYMFQYGIDNVRGGSYDKQKLEEWMIKSLENEFELLRNSKSKEFKDKDFMNLSRLEEEVEKISNNHLERIDKEINKYSKIRQMMLKIKLEIVSTSIRDVESFDKFIDEYENYQLYLPKYKEFELLIEQYNHFRNSRFRNNQEVMKLENQIKILINQLFADSKSSFYNMIDIRNIVIESIRYDVRKSPIEKFNSKIPDISRCYHNYLSYIGKTDQIFETDILCQLYQLQIFNLENKKKLDRLIKENGSEDDILLKLNSLYKEKLAVIHN